jgi:PAS domain S-box-containing protein
MPRFDPDCLHAIFEASPDAMYAKDLDGIYTAMNPAGARLIGKPLEDILGRTDRGVFDEATALRIGGVDERVISQRETITYEDTASWAGGARTYSTTKGPLVSADGTVKGMFGISRDLQREQLASVAYELRGPLGTIANAANLLRRTATGPAVELLAIIGDETARAEAVVTEMLDLRPNLPARSPQLLLRLFESSQALASSDPRSPDR